MEMNEYLAAVHAYLCADGYVVKNPLTQKHKYHRVGLRNQNLVLLQDFQERFERVFGIKPHLREGERCEIGSREIYEKLTDSFGSFYSWHWSMPKLDKSLYGIWLRAFFDCEGWVTCNSHQNRQIGVDCVNEKGLLQVYEALKMLGISSKVKKRNTRDIYHLSIYGKESIIAFRERVGFLHPDKKGRLDDAINDFVDYVWRFPEKDEELIEFIKQVFIARAKIKKQSGIIRLVCKEEINLIILQKELTRLFGIDPRVNRRTNGIGTVYFELNVNKKEQVKKLIELRFLSSFEKEKWMKLNK